MRLNKKGISLIVLVITIVVMIILGAAIILSLSSGNIRGKANEAVTSNDVATAKEIIAVAQSEWEINYDELSDKYNNVGEYATDKLKSAGIKTTGEGSIEVLADGTMYKYPKIPEGFVVSDISTEDQVSEGLVIYEGTSSVKDDTDAQTTRNQFVWVPVNSIAKFKRINWQNPSYSEPYSAGYATEATEYNAMYESIKKHGGFFIGRYEAGVSSARSTYGTDLNYVVQKDKYVYNYVAWGAAMNDINSDVTPSSSNYGKGAVYLSQNMKLINKSDIVTTLIYGVQWDATMNFLSDIYNENGKRFIDDSTGMGVYKASEPSKTGSNDAYRVKNIYDLAGNVSEWTMEEYHIGTRIERAFRGGSFSNSGSEYPASYGYAASVSYVGRSPGFRVAMYLK